MVPHPSRRTLLQGGVALTAWSAIPRTARAAAPRDPRFVLVVLRGGMDGIAAVAPVGDPYYDEVRERFGLPTEGAKAGIPLDDFFLLNPRLPTVADLYTRGEALMVHAVHSPYRDRSHFAGQDVLENGTTSSGHHRDGWLGRALATLPTESTIARQGGFAAASATPLVLRGASGIVTWLPSGMPAASDDTRARLLSLYEHTDPTLAKALSEGLDLDAITGGEAVLSEGAQSAMEGMGNPRHARQDVAAGLAAGRSLARDDGPRVAFLDMVGFDTHRGQLVVDGFLGTSLSRLDAMIAALKDSLGAAWSDTVVAVVTEFGRTIRMNGSNGTDHGMATAAMLLGGAVNGGRVVADWPGLAPEQLYENRDLRPTVDLRQVLKGALRDHLGLTKAELASTVFPDTTDLAPMDRLIR